MLGIVELRDFKMQIYTKQKKQKKEDEGGDCVSLQFAGPGGRPEMRFYTLLLSC